MEKSKLIVPCAAAVIAAGFVITESAQGMNVQNQRGVQQERRGELPQQLDANVNQINVDQRPAMHRPGVMMDNGGRFARFKRKIVEIASGIKRFFKKLLGIGEGVANNHPVPMNNVPVILDEIVPMQDFPLAHDDLEDQAGVLEENVQHMQDDVEDQMGDAQLVQGAFEAPVLRGLNFGFGDINNAGNALLHQLMAEAGLMDPM